METGMDSVDIPTPGGRHPRVVSPPRLSLSTPSAALRWQRPAPDTPSSAKTTFTSKTMEETQEQLWYELAEFYYRNEDTIERVMAMDIGSLDKVSQMDLAIDTFVETANLLLPGLVALANVHPGLGIAVFAFAGVIGLDITRRDNNRKVLAVKLQMQNMMCAMFQLRKLRHMHVQEPEREQEQTRLHRLIGDIAEEIKICGSDLDYYMDRKFVCK
ncbi:hypothetical protein BDZ97DRAFT_1407109 [Flammula alnicola]|nr:hypothetical protein BDZ97DRAFT_1407109 [Flammula alnicola]